MRSAHAEKQEGFGVKALNLCEGLGSGLGGGSWTLAGCSRGRGLRSGLCGVWPRRAPCFLKP